MPSPIVNFRAGPDFVSALAQAAEQAGESKSDFICEAVASRVDSEPAEVPAFDPERTLLLAAVGDTGAQRAMANRAYQSFLQAADTDPNIAAIAMAECLTFARMAALQGTTHDFEILVFVLARFGEWQNERGCIDLGQKLDAASLNLAEALADHGHEAMAEIVAGSGVMSAETFQEARRQRVAA